jgi:hypothetical protein
MHCGSLRNLKALLCTTKCCKGYLGMHNKANVLAASDVGVVRGSCSACAYDFWNVQDFVFSTHGQECSDTYRIRTTKSVSQCNSAFCWLLIRHGQCTARDQPSPGRKTSHQRHTDKRRRHASVRSSRLEREQRNAHIAKLNQEITRKERLLYTAKC